MTVTFPKFSRSRPSSPGPLTKLHATPPTSGPSSPATGGRTSEPSSRTSSPHRGRRSLLLSSPPDSPRHDSPSPSRSIALNFDSSILRVAGETITGTVLLSIPYAGAERLQSVSISLLCKLDLDVDSGMGPGPAAGGPGLSFVRSRELAKEEHVIWTRETVHALDSEEDGMLVLPFELTLPSDLPPSMETTAPSFRARVKCTIEVKTSIHHGGASFFHQQPKRLRVTVPITSAATPSQALARSELAQGWDGAWHALPADRHVRRGGREGDVHVDLLLPDLDSFPVGVDLPFSFRLSCTSTEGSQVEEDGEAFPAPPEKLSSMTLDLERRIVVPLAPAGQGGSGTARTHPERVLTHLAGASGDILPQRVVVEPLLLEPLPAPAEGVRRTLVVHSSFRLPETLPPTFSIPDLLTSAYALRLRVPIAGKGNNLEATFPIKITSGKMTPPPPVDALESTSRPASLDLDTPGELPPEYAG